MTAFETPWKTACFGELEELKVLHANGAKLDDVDDRGFTPMLWASRNGHQEVVAFLCENGCSKETSSFGGMRPLHHACNKNHEKLIRFLLKEGVDVNAVDENGDTALHYCCARGVLNIVTVLLDAGANCLIPNSVGVTPVMKAAFFGHMSVVKRLVEGSGADKDGADVNGDTVLHFACKAGFEKIVRLLLDNDVDLTKKNKSGLSAEQCCLTGSLKELFPGAAAAKAAE